MTWLVVQAIGWAVAIPLLRWHWSAVRRANSLARIKLDERLGLPVGDDDA